MAVPYLYGAAEAAYHIDPVHVGADGFDFFGRDRGDNLEVKVVIKRKDLAYPFVVHAVKGFVKNYKPHGVFGTGFEETVEACGDGHIVGGLGFAAGFFFQHFGKGEFYLWLRFFH